MSQLPRTLLPAAILVAALAAVSSAALAHGPGHRPQAPGPGAILGEMGPGMMRFLGGWLSDSGTGAHPIPRTSAGTDVPTPPMPALPGESAPIGPNGVHVPQILEMPGLDGPPVLPGPGWQMLMVPGWWN